MVGHVVPLDATVDLLNGQAAVEAQDVPFYGTSDQVFMAW
jgi:hypothetical protein